MGKRKRESSSSDLVLNKILEVLGTDVVYPVDFKPNGAVEFTLRSYASVTIKKLTALLGVNDVYDGSLLKNAPPNCLRVRLMKDQDDECYKRGRQDSRKQLQELEQKPIMLGVPNPNEAVNHLAAESRKMFPGSSVSHDRDKVMEFQCPRDLLFNDILKFHGDNISDIVSCTVHPGNIIRLVTFRA